MYIWYYLHRYFSLYVNVSGYACKFTTISNKIHDEAYHFWTKCVVHIYMKCEVQSYLV